MRGAYLRHLNMVESSAGDTLHGGISIMFQAGSRLWYMHSVWCTYCSETVNIIIG